MSVIDRALLHSYWTQTLWNYRATLDNEARYLGVGPPLNVVVATYYMYLQYIYCCTSQGKSCGKWEDNNKLWRSMKRRRLSKQASNWTYGFWVGIFGIVMFRHVWDRRLGHLWEKSSNPLVSSHWPGASVALQTRHSMPPYIAYSMWGTFFLKYSSNNS